MIISRTPYRISFFGGGSDYPQWYREHGGQVLATSINKYCYITCRYLPPFFEHRYRVAYSEIENVQSIDQIHHPAVRETLKYLGIDRGVEIHHDGDLPARSGMGSSSSFTVGLLNALHALQGRMMDTQHMAGQAIYIERDRLGETVGSQDQTLAAHGGFNHIAFGKDGNIDVRPVTLRPERIRELQDHLMLFYTGIQRTASDIAATYVNGAVNLQATMDAVDEGLGILNSHQDICAFGELLHWAWGVKKSLSLKITSPDVDWMYEAALAGGAIGGKLLGAGGGGFMLLFVAPEYQSKVKEVLNKLTHVPFKFESQGSQIIFYDVEEDYTEVENGRLVQAH